MPVSYLVYFDYRRRNDAEFRRQLKKTERKYLKEKEMLVNAEQNVLKVQIEKALKDSLAKDPLPEDMAARENFFVSEIARADELIDLGESQAIPAALAFYRALSVYPNPVDLLSIYDKSVKEPVLSILRTMLLIEPPATIKNVFGGSAAGGVPTASSGDGDFSASNVE